MNKLDPLVGSKNIGQLGVARMRDISPNVRHDLLDVLALSRVIAAEGTIVYRELNHILGCRAPHE